MPLNHDRLEALRHAVLTGTGKFDMSHHETCLIGIACELETGKPLDQDTNWWGSGKFLEWLGFTLAEIADGGYYHPLWNPVHSGMLTCVITREMAADMLKRLGETGKVQWIEPDGAMQQEHA